jgi:predicted AAA+ superfamily ATPase
MPHLRTRHIQLIYQKLIRLSPIVGIFGHRQVGKTTLLEQSVKHYETFDNHETLASATDHPTQFLKRLTQYPVGIDEAQLLPSLFPALKEWVRIHKRPGQFVLSGSVRFSSRRAIRESLTGRLMGIELLPLTLTELHQESLPETAIELMKLENFEHFTSELAIKSGEFAQRSHLIDKYLEAGGLPGVCFIREPKFRGAKLQDQLSVILDRDIRLIYPTTLTLRETELYARELASQEGNPVRFTLLRKKIKLSEATQKKLLQAFEGVFLLRVLPIEGSRKGLSIIFEDQAEAKYLSHSKIPKKTQLAHLIFRNLREQFNYRPGENANYFSYMSRGGVRVPFAIRTEMGELGVIAIEGELPSKKDLFAAQSFVRTYGNGKCLLVTFGTKTVKPFGSRILQLPAEWLLFSNEKA